MSCAGHPDVQTPHLDRLAHEGSRFTHAYANNPICTPSRMSFLSGMYPSTHGYYGLYGQEPQHSLTSMFKHYKEQGYRTGALGKLHTPRYWVEKDCQFVYDEFVEHPTYLEGAGLYDVNDNRPFTGNRDGQTSHLPLEHSCEVALAKQTLRFMNNEGEPKDRGRAEDPWFAWVSFSRPHQPYTPSEPFASMYDHDRISLPPISESEKGDILSQRSQIQETELRKMVSAYYGLVSQIDYAIGMILDALEQRGELKNTVIVYTSDHGDYAGEHGLMEKKGGISYQAITRIPFIVRYPGQQAKGTVYNELIESVDVFPTLCELSGMDSPHTLQGISLLPILNGQEQDLRKDAYTENPYRKALATKQWRYVANLHGQQDDELYDLQEDPWELHNKIHDSKYEPIRQQMLRKLLDRSVRASKPSTTINGNWHDHVYDEDGRIDLNHCGQANEYW